MGFEQIDEAVKAGEAAENADFHTTAAINPLKVAKRAVYVPCFFNGAIVSGAITDSAAGAFPGKLLPDAGASYILLGLLMPRAEISPGESAILHIFWTTASIAGNLRLVADIRPVIAGAANLASAVQRAIIQVANGVANAFSEAKIEFPPALFANNQHVSVKIARDGTNTLDTVGADIIIRAVYLEIQGRC